MAKIYNLFMIQKAEKPYLISPYIVVLYGPANDPQIGPQMIPRPEMIPANGVAKNREWRGLHE